MNEEGEKSQHLQPIEPPTEGSITPKRLSFKQNRVSDLATSKTERSHSLDPLQFMKDMDLRKRRASSISSLGNWTGAVIVSDMSEGLKKTNGKWFVSRKLAEE